MRSFVDTNVLLYADDAAHRDKHERAIVLVESLYRQREAVLSLQVLREYFVIATRKLGLPAAAAAEHVYLFAQAEIIEETVEDVYAAIDLHRLRGYSLWDCLIMRAALKSGCRRLYSEDLQHGQTIEGLEIVNPFT